MAATKKPKTAKTSKTMDVSHPQETVPDASARPLIVGNRSIIQDPMVKGAEDNSDEEPSTSPLLAAHPKKLEPQQSVPPPKKPLKASGDTAPLVDKVAIKKDKNPAPTDPEIVSESDAPEETEESKQTSPTESRAPKKPEQAAPTDEDSSQSSEEAVETSDSDQDEPANIDEVDQSDKKAAEAEAKAAEQAEHVAELIEQKTYFLPIKHQARQGSRIALVLLLVAAVTAAVITYMMQQSLL